jgi:signal transduction histidine kinase
MIGILLIGILTKTIAESNVHFSIYSMVAMSIMTVCFNLLFYFLAKRAEKSKSAELVKLLGASQIAYEVGMFTVIMHFSGGIEGISPIYYFLPIAAAALLFGARGAFITAFFSAFFINILVIGEYYNIIQHVPRYFGQATIEFENLSVALSKTIAISIYYVIIGWFVSYSTDIIFNRERMLEEKSEQMDDQTRMLIRRDIKLLEANQELIEEKNKVSSIIANFADPIIFLSQEERIDLLNPAAREILGMDESSLGEKISPRNKFSLANFKRFIKPEIEIKPLGDMSEGGFALEEATVKKGKDEKIYKVMTAPVYNGDRTAIFGHIKIFYDLTREKAIDRLKSEFISIAAHQLRTPLTSIKWVIKMAMDGDAGPLNIEQKELLEKGYISNERVIRLVNDLLNVSRIEEGRFGYVFEKNDFQEIINTVIENIEGEVAKKHINLIIKKPEKIPLVKIDKNKMVMVMQNLLDNGVKYSPEGSKLELKMETTENFLKVSVKDSGIGIPAGDKDKLFTKFFRAANVAKAEIEGTGLGLFIVKNIIDRHGGVISVKSEEGKGTEVSFLLPL